MTVAIASTRGKNAKIGTLTTSDGTGGYTLLSTSQSTGCVAGAKTHERFKIWYINAEDGTSAIVSLRRVALRERAASIINVCHDQVVVVSVANAATVRRGYHVKEAEAVI